MRGDKLPKPSSVCSVCAALSSERRHLNQRCTGMFGGRRCYGISKIATGRLWDQCESCGATGRVGSQVCGACLAFGWKMYA
jgi:hypothetical protein